MMRYTHQNFARTEPKTQNAYDPTLPPMKNAACYTVRQMLILWPDNPSSVYSLPTLPTKIPIPRIRALELGLVHGSYLPSRVSISATIVCSQLRSGYFPRAATVISFCSSRYASASIAALHPSPAAVTACRYRWSCTSPATKTPFTLVLVPRLDTT